MANLLQVQALPAGQIRLTDWVRRNKDTIGRYYASELRRRRDRTLPYEVT